MGRTLTNAMVNLGIDSEVEEALYEVYTAVHTCTCMHAPAPQTNVLHVLYIQFSSALLYIILNI